MVKTKPQLPPMLQVGDVILSTELLTEYFCCDLDRCHGACCVEGDAGAPVTLDEVAEMERVYPDIEADLAPAARDVVARQGMAYVDKTGELVTSIVDGRECIFACCGDGGCTLCASDRAYRQQRTTWDKPISCALYPIRERRFAGGLVGLSYHRWDICQPARQLGRTLRLPIYQFLREPLVRRFGQAWYDELEQTVTELRKHRYL